MLLKNLKPSSLPEWKRLDTSGEDSDKRTTANLEAKVKAQASILHRSLWLQECLHPLIMPHNSSPRQTPGFSSLSRMACLGHTRTWEQPHQGSYSASITPLQWVFPWRGDQLSAVGFFFLSCVLLVIVFAVVNQCREEQVLLKPISLPSMAGAVRLVEKCPWTGS